MNKVIAHRSDGSYLGKRLSKSFLPLVLPFGIKKAIDQISSGFLPSPMENDSGFSGRQTAQLDQHVDHLLFYLCEIKQKLA